MVLREHGSGTRKVFDSSIHHLIGDLDVEPFLESGQLVTLNVPVLEMERTLSFIWRADMAEKPLAECIKREGKRMMKSTPSVL